MTTLLKAHISLTGPSAFQCVLPSGVATAEWWGAGHASLLRPEEYACIKGASVSRIREFAAGRYCARKALKVLDQHPPAISARKDRTPEWPLGIVGSITHADGLAGAAVSTRAKFAAIGVDAELIGGITGDLWPDLFTTDEIASLQRCHPLQAARLGIVMFSAKESFYKCQYPITGQWLDFRDVQVVIQAGYFAVKPSVRLPIGPGPYVGQYHFRGRYAITGIALRRKRCFGAYTADQKG